MVEPRVFGEGAGSAEVPRGILFHVYELADEDRIADANLIITEWE
jgi:coenzyme F420-reducing hydrogenase alpha subunit